MSIGFWWKSQKERDHQEDLDLGRRLILNLNLKRNKMGLMDLVFLAQNRDQ
jgi:hypothetical protein